MSKIGIIGGSGLTQLKQLTITRREVVNTSFGEASGAFTHGILHGKEVVFLARHGNSHHILPHEINYRANLAALQSLGVDRVIAFNAVGGITPAMAPASIAIPNQIIDYTYGREHTFFGQQSGQVVHVDFTSPYSEPLREAFCSAAEAINVTVAKKAIYGATQGPRLETAAEVERLERDGCDIVGMTGMPEAALARELDMSYVSCCIVANWAAGKSAEVITMEDINANLTTAMATAGALLDATISQL